MQKTSLQIEKMSCGHCEQAIKEALEKIKGVSSASVSLQDRLATIEYDETTVTLADMVQAVEEAGYIVI